MDFRLSDRATSYRERVRKISDAYLTETVRRSVRESGTAHSEEIYKALAAENWIGATWPTELGGSGMHPAEHGAIWESLNYFSLPVDLVQLTEMAAYVVCEVGTPQQKEEVLPQIAKGRLLISLGYTEPDAGSDVAAAKTTAIRDGEGWRIHGSKIFTTGAEAADLVLLLVRTDSEVPKHKGLSMFLVPLSTPGIEVQPIATFGGERTNTTFYEDVWVPESALIGQPNRGWDVLNVGLNFERLMFGPYIGRAQRIYDDLIAALRAELMLDSPMVQHQLMTQRTRIETARAVADHVYCLSTSGNSIAAEAAMAKLLVTEIFKDLSYLALDLVGPKGLLENQSELLPNGGSLEHWFRHSQIATIYGGTNEIQRNIISRQLLNLPRG